MIQLDFPNLSDPVVTRQGGILPPGPGGVRLEIDALGDKDVRFAGGLLRKCLGKIFHERVEDLLPFEWSEVQAVFAERLEHGVLDNVLVDPNGDAVEVDDAAANLFRDSELLALDAFDYRFRYHPSMYRTWMGTC